MLELSNVTKLYGGRTAVAALRDVSLHLDTGALVAIMGPSGSGKSTLLNIVGGLDSPTSGSVVVGGRNLAPMTESQRSVWRRTEVSFVFQSYHLLPTLSAAENIALPLHVQGLSRADVDERVRGVLADVGLSDRASHLPDELSGGERQRVAMARALVTRPKLLLADEPTGNLDTATGVHVLTLLLDATRARGATLLMVTHNQQAADRCDRTIRLRDGQIDESSDA